MERVGIGDIFERENPAPVEIHKLGRLKGWHGRWKPKGAAGR